MKAPVGSSTVPVICPVSVWPKAHGASPVSVIAHANTKNAITDRDLTLHIYHPPWVAFVSFAWTHRFLTHIFVTSDTRRRVNLKEVGKPHPPRNVPLRRS